MTPRHIPAVEKLKLSVRTEGVDARQVEVDFSGVDMNMGFNRVSLAPIGPSEFAGTGMLPVCVRARMTWEAKVLLDTDAGLAAATCATLCLSASLYAGSAADGVQVQDIYARAV